MHVRETRRRPAAKKQIYKLFQSLRRRLAMALSGLGGAERCLGQANGELADAPGAPVFRRFDGSTCDAKL